MKHCARAELCKVVGAVGNHFLYYLCPEHWSGKLSDEVFLDFLWVGVRHCVYILINRADWCRELSLVDGGCELVVSRLHQWRVERTAHFQFQRAACACCKSFLASGVDAFFNT